MCIYIFNLFIFIFSLKCILHKTVVIERGFFLFFLSLFMFCVVSSAPWLFCNNRTIEYLNHVYYNIIGYYNSVFLNIYVIIILVFILSFLKTKLTQNIILRRTSVFCVGLFFFYELTLFHYEQIEYNLLDFAQTNLLKSFNTALINPIVVIHPLIIQIFYALSIITIIFNKQLILTLANNPRVGLYTTQLLGCWLKSPIFFAAYLTFFLGSWWALQELNWNNWWNWDFIELISFLFVIAAFYLVHSLKKHSVQGTLYTVFFSFDLIIGFSLISVRTDIFNSLHAFNFFDFFNLFFFIFWLVFFSFMTYKIFKKHTFFKNTNQKIKKNKRNSLGVIKTAVLFLIYTILVHCSIVFFSSFDLIFINIDNLFFLKYFIKSIFIVFFVVFFLKKVNFKKIIIINLLTNFSFAAVWSLFINFTPLRKRSSLVNSHILIVLYGLILEFNLIRTPVAQVLTTDCVNLIQNECFVSTASFSKFELLPTTLNTYLNNIVDFEINNVTAYTFEFQQQQTSVNNNVYPLKHLLKNTLINIFDLKTVVEVFFYNYTTIFYFNLFIIFWLTKIFLFSKSFKKSF